MKINFNTIIYSFSTFAFVLLAGRMLRNESMAYIFLAWNLFLAFVPFWISSFLVKQKQLKLSQIPLIGLWLVFIPNAPYILTDFFHLKQRQGIPFWLDLILVLSFALIGLILFYKSLFDMIELLKTRITSFHLNYIIPLMLWIIAFGLYLGRYGRFNSWDIVQHPFILVKSSCKILSHKDTIGFTCIFSVFMWFVYLTLITFNTKQKQ